MNKYDPHLEDQFQKLGDERIAEKKYLVFDKDARVLKREKFPDLVKSDRTFDENCLVIINKQGEAIVITSEIERAIYAIWKTKNDSKAT